MSAAETQKLRAELGAIEQSQGAAAALAKFDAAAKLHELPADLWNFAGNIAMRCAEPHSAAQRFGKAAAIDPHSAEYAINQAIAHSAANDIQAALRALAPHEAAGAKSARYCSVRANAARNAGDLAQAAQWYDNALTLEPTHLKAMNGRARVAIERAEPDALARFDNALRIDSGNADLWLGKAQSLDVEGDTKGARIIAQQLVDQAPNWIEGLRFMAQLRLSGGETDFTAHYRDAAAKVPQDPNIPFDHITQLAALDYAEEAAEVAAHAARNFPNQPQFQLLEASYAGASGEDERAEGIFAKLELSTADRNLKEARHRIRRREFDRAQTLLESALSEDTWSVSAWALLGIVWRCIDDPRADWLHAMLRKKQRSLASCRFLHIQDCLERFDNEARRSRSYRISLSWLEHLANRDLHD